MNQGHYQSDDIDQYIYIYTQHMVYLKAYFYAMKTEQFWPHIVVLNLH